MLSRHREVAAAIGVDSEGQGTLGQQQAGLLSLERFQFRHGDCYLRARAEAFVQPRGNNCGRNIMIRPVGCVELQYTEAEYVLWRS